MFGITRGPWQKQRSQRQSSSQSQTKYPSSPHAGPRTTASASFRPLPPFGTHHPVPHHLHQLNQLEPGSVQNQAEDCIAQAIPLGDVHGPTNPEDYVPEKDPGYLFEAVGRRASGNVGVCTTPVSLEGILRAAATERLQSMPHRASKWDQVIRQVEEFALKVSSLASQSEPPRATSDPPRAIYACLYQFLQLGSVNAVHLESAILTLSRISQALALLQPRNSKQDLFQLLACISNIMPCLLLRCQVSARSTSQNLNDAESNLMLRRHLEEFSQLIDQLIQQSWSSSLSSEAGQSNPDVSIADIRQWLKPRDRIIQSKYTEVLASQNTWAEFTCEWFSGHLLAFVQGTERTFWIEGPLGSGKSVLYHWVLDRLQRSVGKTTYSVVSYAADPLFPTEANITSLIKSLLLQIFDKNIARQDLYLLLSDLVRRVRVAEDGTEIEQAVLQTLNLSLRSHQGPLVVVIDGMNYLDGDPDEVTSSLTKMLQSFTTAPDVSLICFSRSISTIPEMFSRHLRIESPYVQDDIRRAMETFRPAINSELVHSVTDKAQQSFLWPLLYLQNLQARSQQQSLADAPLRLSENLETLVKGLMANITSAHGITHWILSTCAVACRPLKVEELESLAKHENDRGQHGGQSSDIHSALSNCKMVLTIYEGLVFFRHPLFRDHWLVSKPTANSSGSLEHDRDMTIQLLRYMTNVQGEQNDLTYQPIPPHVLDEALLSYPLLDYALSYYTTHYARSDLPNVDDSVSAASHSYSVQPESVYFANLQSTFWQSRPFFELMATLPVMIGATHRIFGDSKATLQAIASLTNVFDRCNRYPQAAAQLVNAFRLAQAILPVFHPFTVTIVSKFLETVDKVVDADAIGIANNKPRMMQYLIDMYGQQEQGPNGDMVLVYNNLLWQYYVESSNGPLAAQVLRHMYNIQADRYGKSSLEAKATAKNLMTVLQRSNERDNDLLQDDSIFDEIVGSFDLTDPRRVHASLSKAAFCNSRKDLADAELIYVTVWHDIACYGQDDAQKLERELEVGLSYSQFLQEHARVSEAQGVLLSLWRSCEHLSTRSQATLRLIKELATEFMKVGLPSKALVALHYVSDWEKDEAAEASSIAETESLFLGASKEALNSSSEPPSVSSMRNALDSNINQAQDAQNLDPMTLKLVDTLCQKYTRSKSWPDLIVLCRKVLGSFAPELLDGSGGLPKSNNKDTLDPLLSISFTLGHAYERLNQVLNAANMYRNIFMVVVRVHQSPDGPWTSRAFDAAIAGYEKLDQMDAIVDLQETHVDHHVLAYGESDERTVERLYMLASLLEDSNKYQEALGYYRRIANTFQHEDHHEQIALPALRALSRIFRDQNRWSELEETYRCLWLTFLNKGGEYGITTEIARGLYTDLTQLLRNKLLAGPDLLCDIAEDYWRGCASAFGEPHQATQEAAFLLAEVCSQDCQDIAKAANVYEWILDMNPTQLDHEEQSSSIVAQAVEHMTEFYRQQVQGSMESKQIDRAMKLQSRQYRMDAQTHGPVSSTTLSSLSHWISFLRKQGSQQSQRVIVIELRNALDAIVPSDAGPADLHEAAIVLAGSYVSSGCVEEAFGIVQELQQEIIFNTNEMQAPRPSALMLLTTFEARLSRSTLDLAEVHSRAIIESLMWQNYQRLSRSSSQPDIALLTCGAKLRSLLLEHGLFGQGGLLEERLFDDFMRLYGSAFTISALDTSLERSRQLFLVFIDDIGTQRQRLVIDIPRSICSALDKRIRELLDQGQYATVLNLSLPGLQLLEHLNAFSQASQMKTGLDLSLLLAGRGGFLIHDRVHGSQLLDISKNMLQSLFRRFREQDFGFSSMGIEYLSRVASVLGVQQNYEDLEWLLTKLWLGRHSRKDVDEHMMVTLGRRLVEVRFSHGHVDSAIDLAEDILYNLRRVYGATHHSVIDMTNLLSSIHIASGDHAAAAAVDRVHPHDPSIEECRKSGISTVGDPTQAFEVVKNNLEYLLHFYKGSRGTTDKPASQYASTIQELSKRLDQFSDSPRPSTPGRDPSTVNWGFADERIREIGDDEAGSFLQKESSRGQGSFAG